MDTNVGAPWSLWRHGDPEFVSSVKPRRDVRRGRAAGSCAPRHAARTAPDSRWPGRPRGRRWQRRVLADAEAPASRPGRARARPARPQRGACRRARRDRTSAMAPGNTGLQLVDARHALGKRQLADVLQARARRTTTPRSGSRSAPRASRGRHRRWRTSRSRARRALKTGIARPRRGRAGPGGEHVGHRGVDVLALAGSLRDAPPRRTRRTRRPSRRRGRRWAASTPPAPRLRGRAHRPTPGS